MQQTGRLVMRALLHLIAPPRLGRAFALLLATTWLAGIADGILLAAGPLLVASLTEDALLVAMAATVQWLPKLLLALVAGAVTDRVDRARMVGGVNVARALLLAVLVAMIISGHVSIGAVLVVFFLFGVAEVFADNALHALIPSVIPRGDLAPGNARLQSANIVGNQLAGPPIGAALFVAGAAVAISAQAVLLVLGAVLVLRIVLPAAPLHAGVEDAGEQGAAGSVWQDMREGVAWVWRHRVVRTMVITITTFNVAFGAGWSVLVLYASEHVGLGEVGFGLLTTISAVGGLLGTFAYGWITQYVSLGGLMRIGLLIETSAYLALALVSAPAAVMTIFFVFGAHAFIWNTTSVTIRQRAVPQRLQGRVNGVNMLGVFGGMVVGSLLGGVLARRWGVLAPFWFAFAVAVVLVALLWRPLGHVAHADAALDEPQPASPA